MKFHRSVYAIGLPACAVLSLSTGCSETRPVSAALGRHIDSILPLDESLRRFRGGLSRVEVLSGGTRSKESLIRAFARAVEHSDTAAIRRLVLSRAEFAYLYYPSSPYSRPPYSHPPDLLWLEFQLNSEKGIVRMLRRLGGQPFPAHSARCDQPISQEENRLWEGCKLRLTVNGDTATRRLFGTIIERQGRFKFVSYANDF